MIANLMERAVVEAMRKCVAGDSILADDRVLGMLARAAIAGSGAAELMRALQNLLDSVEVDDDRAVLMAMDAIANAEGRMNLADATKKETP